MNEPEQEHLFEEILQSLEQDPSLKLEDMLALHPKSESSVRRFWTALADYRQASSLLAVGSHETLVAGTSIGDFEIDGLVGRGGMGEVYRARQRSLNDRVVALKVLSRAACHATGIARFNREAAMLAELHHPNLAEIYGIGEVGGVLYYAMRFVPGVTLGAAIGGDNDGASEAFLLRERVGWITQVASALAVVHQGGLVHRDVKPSNVMLEPAPGHDGARRAVLIDFGLVRQAQGVSDATLTGYAAATPGYASPEQLLGRSVDARADVFALGVTLHDLVTQRVPSSRLPATVGLEPLQSLVKCADADLTAVVAKALDPDARWRYRDATEFGADLERWLAGEAVVARRAPVSERLRRWIRDHPASIARAFVMISALTLAGIGVGLLTGYVSSAREVRNAHERMDLVRLVEAARGIPRALFPLLLKDEDLIGAARRATDLDEGDPLASVIELLGRQARMDALFVATTRVTVLGLGRDRLLQGFLAKALQDYVQAPGEGDALLVFVSRLFYESPVLGAAERHEARIFRECLVAILFDEDRRREDRLLALSALSGCGDSGDVLPTLKLALGYPHAAEEHRLGIACVERILRRCLGGQLGPVPHREVTDLYAPHVRDLFAQWSAGQLDGRAILDALNAVEAIAFASRAAAVRLSSESFLPPSWADPSSLGGFWALRWALQVYAAFADARVMPFLRQGVLLEDGRLEARTLGRLAGAYGDPALTAQAAEACCQQLALGPNECAPVLARFAEGVASLSRRREAGRMTETEPDIETRLEAIPEDGRGRELDAHTGEAAGSVARWDFRTDPPTIAGTASGISLSFGDMRFDERSKPFLRMWHFGESEVRLGFSVAANPESPMFLSISHQPALRRYYPYEGEVRLRISLDGKPVALSLAIDGGTQRLEIPVRLINRGEHVLSIRCERGTTTTYRLFGVRLSEAE